MTANNEIEKSLQDLGAELASDDSIAEAVMARLNNTKIEKPNKPLLIRRLTMKNRITKIAAAAVIVIVTMFALNTIGLKIGEASAAELFAQALTAMPELKSVHIKAQMRTNTKEDHFDAIEMDGELVPVEMWKVFDGPPGKWRIENPGKIVVMDGTSSLLFFTEANFAKKGMPGDEFAGWLEGLLSVDHVVKLALLSAVQEAADFQLTHEVGEDGWEKLLVIAEFKAKGDFTTSDYLRNKYVNESDNRHVYRFDSATKLLESLEIYVHTEREDVLVFEITEIQYNPEIDSKLFTLDLPENVRWPQQLKEKWVYDEKYAELTPMEMAISFFQSCSDENWEQFLEFEDAETVSQHTKDYLGSLKIISIGEPFKSGRYIGWFVPYEIQLKDGTIKKHNLAVRNDNPGKRYVLDGGI